VGRWVVVGERFSKAGWMANPFCTQSPFAVCSFFASGVAGLGEVGEQCSEGGIVVVGGAGRLGSPRGLAAGSGKRPWRARWRC